MIGLKAILCIFLLLNTTLSCKIEGKFITLAHQKDIGNIRAYRYQNKLKMHSNILLGTKTLDKDGNCIADYLDEMIRHATGRKGEVELFVFPKKSAIPDLEKIFVAMEPIQKYRWYDIISAYYVKVPKFFLTSFIERIENKFYWIEENLRVTINGIIPQYMIGVHKLWDLGVNGSKHITVGIIDSGIDPRHIDFRNKLVYYRDITGESEKPIDNIGHGTMISSIIAGTGVAAEGGLMGIVCYGVARKIEEDSLVLEVSRTTQANITLIWDSSEDLRIYVKHILANGSESIVINTTERKYSLNITCYRGLNRFRISTNGGEARYVLRVEYKPDKLSEKFARGVAPNVNLAVWKVFRGLNISTDVATILLALSDVIRVSQKYNITIINLSISTNKRSVALDEAVNEVALHGILVVTSAGNNYIEMYKEGKISGQIMSPGTAQYAITVAAMNDLYGVALYSSRGGKYLENSWEYVKPDVIMFGGGKIYGKWAIGSDSDTCDYVFPDIKDNDYLMSYGTSFSAAYISGALALISGLLFDEKKWEWSLEQVLKIKSLVLASSFEVALIGKHETEYNLGQIRRNIPPFSNGSKDYDEGFGVPYIPACIELLDKIEVPSSLEWSDIISLDNPVSGKRIQSEDLIKVSFSANSTDTFLYVYSLYENDGSPKLQRVLCVNTSTTFLGSGDMVIVAKILRNCTIRIGVTVETLIKRTTLTIIISGIIITVMVIVAYVTIKIVNIIRRILKKRKKRNKALD